MYWVDLGVFVKRKIVSEFIYVTHHLSIFDADKNKESQPLFFVKSQLSHKSSEFLVKSRFWLPEFAFSWTFFLKFQNPKHYCAFTDFLRKIQFATHSRENESFHFTRILFQKVLSLVHKKGWEIWGQLLCV